MSYLLYGIMIPKGRVCRVSFCIRSCQTKCITRKLPTTSESMLAPARVVRDILIFMLEEYGKNYSIMVIRELVFIKFLI